MISENPVYQSEDGVLEYVKITVKAYSHGVPYHGRYYTRSGGTKHELVGAELTNFLYDKVGMKWDPSYPANPTIDTGLFFAGAMDTWGQGFLLIKDECEKIDAPLPEIKATDKYVTVTIRGCRKYMELLQSTTSIGDEDRPKDDSSNGSETTLSHSAVEVDISPELLLEVLEFCNTPRKRTEIKEFCGYKSPSHFREKIMNPLLEGGQLVPTIPDKPNSPKQKYIRRTAFKA